MQKLKQMPSARCVKIFGDGVLMQGAALDLAMPLQSESIILLGQDTQQAPWFAMQAADADAVLPLRTIMVDGLLPAEQLSILAQARSLVHWHESHKHCARCGAESQMVDAGYRRHCDTCGGDHFPRTDPVVIMAVCRGKRTLLGRQKSWGPGMYSTLAGFMEPGETIEAAVRREVLEEVGLTVGPVDYVASQPWPYPSSLMIGMIGEALDDALTIDENEIETARWFEADELLMMLDRTHPDGLHASRPDAIAWHLVQAALKRISG